MALSEMMFHVVPPMVIYGQTWGKPMQKPMGQQKKSIYPWEFSRECVSTWDGDTPGGADAPAF